jgi:murein DD-endopeptidase MepM/ murein hydrolase activator NlpD
MSEFVRTGLCRTLFLMPVVLLSGAAPAYASHAHASGAATYEETEVAGVKCKGAKTDGCPRGAELKVTGSGLAQTRAIVFRGRRGAKVSAVPLEANSHAVVVRVPAAARSGRIRATTANATAVGPRLRISKVAARSASNAGAGVFPVRGKHTYGDGLGAGRGHQGQDIFAKCGKPVVAALAGTVTTARSHSAAGNFVVVEALDGTNQVYMHLAAPATVEVGQPVRAGQPLGAVGDTGRASGCHLHFELWSAPGWYKGGSVLDPLPALRAWDRKS